MSRAGQGSRAPRSGNAVRGGTPGTGTRPRRCAVYTRKSSEEGLEQEYNSLHAQREACEAYVRSQHHEGWRLLPNPYDDGGLSGGSMERPALQRLLADIRAGRVDTIVVYKVDRLTRSLADFAKMVEVFDAHDVSFVAVTQQFNTTTSMGRLTLNILLSFAQFEREVTGERIRDKIAASKRRGMWMGGRTPLGYQVVEHKLVVVPEDATTVVQLYRRYLELGSVRELKAALDAEGTVSKPRTFASGTQAGGKPYSRGALYALLSNPTYLGQVRHKEAVYPGQHEAIIPAGLHAAVRARLADSNNGERGKCRAAVEPSPLKDKLFDSSGERLVPSHTRKGERRYRYYVSVSLLRPLTGLGNPGPDANSRAPDPQTNDVIASAGKRKAIAPSLSASTAAGWRLPAREIEQAVEAAARTILQQPAALVPDMLAAGVPPERIQDAMKRLTALAETSSDHVQLVDLSADGMLLTIGTGIDLAPTIVLDSRPLEGDDTATSALVLRRFVPHRVQRRGVEMRLVIGGLAPPVRDDAALLKVVARAHCWFEDLIEGHGTSMRNLAKRLGVTPRYVQRVLPVAFLAPALVEQIATGQQPPALTVDRLTSHGQLPIRWAEQVEQFAT